MDKSKRFNDEDLDQYLVRYVGKRGVNLNRAVTALFELVDDNIIDDTQARKILKVILIKHLHSEIIGEMRADSWIENNKQKMRFMGLRYGRKEEIFI